MKLTEQQLHAIMLDAVNEAPKRKKKQAKKKSPSQLMKTITDALATIGYKVVSREVTPGARKAWLNSTAPRKSPPVDEFGYNDDDTFDIHLDPPPRPSPGRIAMKFKKALMSAGLPVTVTGDSYTTDLRGRGFEVKVPSARERFDIGADLYVAVFAGRYAKDEEEGTDTTDYRFESVRTARFRLSDGTIKEVNVVTNNEASMVEDAPAPTVSIETLRSVEQKFKEILHELPRDFGAMALVVSAAKAIVNARKQAEGKPS